MARVGAAKKWVTFGSLLISCLFASPAHAQTNAAQFWQQQNIYQIITDRFYDGDPANNNADGNFDPTGSKGVSVHGGDFKGIEQKLDYIKALGATAIWISPIIVNGRGEFHGYAGRDFYKVDPHWGRLADLRHLVAAAHARGILVIDDIVANHGGNLLVSTNAGFPKFKMPPDGYELHLRHPKTGYAPPFDSNATNAAFTNLFHDHGHIQDYNNPAQVVLGELSGLDDFKTESDYVRARMAEIYEYWIKEAGFDGFRIDTVKHVEMGFWTNWSPAVRQFAATHGKPHFFMFGEVLDASDAKCGSYTGTQASDQFALDSVLDYPLYFRTKDVFARATGSTKKIEERYAALPANYDATARNALVTFLDNHDQPRFLSPGQANNHQDRLKLALAFMYTSRGIPCLYYGTEQAFNGENDPFDREDMFAGGFEQGPSLGDNFNYTHPLFQWVAKLNNFRRLYPALRAGEHVNLWSNPHGPGLLAYARRLKNDGSPAGAETQELIVVLNTTNAPQTLPARSTAYPAGTKLVNLLEPGEAITVGPGPKIPPIVVPGQSSKIFIAESQSLPLDPVVKSISPAHDATDVAQAALLKVGFSEPMNVASVEKAFSTLPPAEGAFSWSPEKDEVTFTPREPGFPDGTRFTIKIGPTARAAAATNQFQATFESRFHTRSTR